MRVKTFVSDWALFGSRQRLWMLQVCVKLRQKVAAAVTQLEQPSVEEVN